MKADSIENVAASFFKKMAAWEHACKAQFPLDKETQVDQRQALRELYGEHLTAKAASRKQSRCELLSFGEPPDFEKQISKVEPAEKDSYWVYGNLRFHFIREGDGWKIDHKESEVSPGTWRKLIDI